MICMLRFTICGVMYVFVKGWQILQWYVFKKRSIIVWRVVTEICFMIFLLIWLMLLSVPVIMIKVRCGIVKLCLTVIHWRFLKKSVFLFITDWHRFIWNFVILLLVIITMNWRLGNMIRCFHLRNIFIWIIVVILIIFVLIILML